MTDVPSALISPMPTSLDAALAFEPDRRFLGWDRPVVVTAVDALVDGLTGRVLDLSDRLVVVPTRQSGRRLREALAERALERGTGVFPPRVLTPEAFVSEVRPVGETVATPVDALLFWVAVLTDARLSDFPAVFPMPPPKVDFAWALRVAESWQSVRQTLGEGGLDMGAAAARLSADGHAEAERWRDLARMERRYLDRLESAGLVDAQVARRQAAAAPVVPAGVTRIDFIAVSDPMELAVRAAARLGVGGVPVGVMVAAPAERSASFDAWGRPDPSLWGAARDLPLVIDRIHVAVSPRAQAECVRGLASGHVDPAATLALGVADPEVASCLGSPGAAGDEGGSAARLAVHRPEGVVGGDHEVWHLLAGLADVVRERTFRSVGRWLRLPPASGMLRRHAGMIDRVGNARLLRAWDDYAAAHLPESLADGRAFADDVVNPLTAAAEAVVDRFEKAPLPDAVSWVLAELYAGRQFSPDSPAGALFGAMARELSGVLEQVDAAAGSAGVAVPPAEALGCVLDRLRLAQLDASDRPPDAVDINGWLELAWESAPHLIVAGLNDGLVPEVIVADPYLPESVRVRLGLMRTNAARFARDAHLLHLLIAMREDNGGRVDVVLGRSTTAGEPLRPSRLLFLRPDAELPERARVLFGDDRLPAPPPLPARRLAWRIRPPSPSALTRLSVTAFRDYLACPFRFFLRHGLGMESVDPDPRELDAAGFGRLCHAALRALTTDPSLRRCDDPSVIAGFLGDRLRQSLAGTHGDRLTVPLRVQLAAADKRLTAFAHWQAQSVRDGWETIHTELPLADLLGTPWILGGLEIRGVIDRVDARGDERRIIDYKTSDSPRPVAEAHYGKRLSAARLEEEWPSWQIHRGEKDRLYAWRDLQLPLYALAGRQAWGRVPETGYFHLAKAAADCQYEPWTELTGELLDEAETCALGVIQAVQDRRFWPPRPAGAFDDFRWLLTDDPEAAVDASCLITP